SAMSFVSYEKISESTVTWENDEAALRRLQKLTWVATEKIHGANFSLSFDGAELRCAKRKALLEDGQDFFGFEGVRDKLQETIPSLFKAVQTEIPELSSIAVYGELFGGEYPHPEVPKINGVTAIQSGVYYSPDIQFSAFDLAYQTATHRDYLPFDQAMELFDQFGIFHVETLFEGAFKNAMAFPERFSSTIPARLKLPPLAEKNLAEGLVLRPLESVWIETKKGRVRPLIKRKISEFAEDARYNQSEKPVLDPRKQELESYALELLVWAVKPLLNENRCQAAVSKIGALQAGSKEQARELMAFLYEDVIEELEQQRKDALESLSKDDRELFEDYLRSDIEECIEGVYPGFL
ncbi:MAG: RNA ligase family protein, partial [Planctomycetota bacterium]|nr:RNA ligase family protein [Planctomycetota bacterium]